MPKVFISYSWDNEAHKNWAKSFADRLLEDGIDTDIDQYDLAPGDRLTYFMEKSITEAGFVLIICTPRYKLKADSRQGGVGYEGHIITGELVTKGNERKFIPIMRMGDEKVSMPNYLAGKLFIDLREGPNYEEQYKELLITLRGQHKKPPVKRMQFGTSTMEAAQNANAEDEPVHILEIIQDKVTAPRMDGTRGSALYKVPFQLSKRPSQLWKKLFIQFWNDPPHWTTMHIPGIASVYDDEIILDDTTLEEVRDYHKETLVLCVDEANKAEKKYREEEQRKKDQEESRKKQHYEKVAKIAENIQF